METIWYYYYYFKIGFYFGLFSNFGISFYIDRVVDRKDI